MAALLATGCSARAITDAPKPAKRRVARAVRIHPRTVRLRITVVDGDLSRPVRGATVRLGSRAVRTAANGLASIRLPPRRAQRVTVSARHYSARTVFEPLRHSARATIRIYQPRLQWPVYGASAARTETQPSIHLRPPFRIAWSVGNGAMIEFPAVVFDGVAYIGNAQGTVRAISMLTGKVLWLHRTPHGGLASSPGIAGRDLVVHGMDGHVWVLNRRTGRLRWWYTIGAPIESSPVVRDGLDYFGAWDGTVYALDLRSHRLRWTHRSGYKITSSAALVDQTIYIGDYGGRLLALAAGTGRLRFVASVAGKIYGTPAVAGGEIFVPSSDGYAMYAFSLGGRELWAFHTGTYVYSSPAVWQGRVFFGSYNGVFYCLSARSGSILWEVGLRGPISGAAVVIDGIAYAGSFATQIVGVGARTGRVLFRFPDGYYVPVSGNGGRLLLHGYSRIFAVEPR